MFRVSGGEGPSRGDFHSVGAQDDARFRAAWSKGAFLRATFAPEAPTPNPGWAPKPFLSLVGGGPSCPIHTSIRRNPIHRKSY